MMESSIQHPAAERRLPRVLFWIAFDLAMVGLVLVVASFGLPLLAPPRPTDGIRDIAVFIVRTGVTTAVLIAALWVIVSKRYPPADRKWAYGAIAAIMAFWLAAGTL
jgi:hypothetical protein